MVISILVASLHQFRVIGIQLVTGNDRGSLRLRRFTFNSIASRFSRSKRSCNVALLKNQSFSTFCPTFARRDWKKKKSEIAFSIGEMRLTRREPKGGRQVIDRQYTETEQSSRADEQWSEDRQVGEITSRWKLASYAETGRSIHRSLDHRRSVRPWRYGR